MFRCLLSLSLGFAILALIGNCSAQETNFSQGPEYLMNYGDPHFLHPIQTPSLDLSVPRAESPNAPVTEHTGEPDAPGFDGVLQNEPQVDAVYYGATPSGVPIPSTVVIEGTPAEPSASGPVLFNAGVTAMTSDMELRHEGYGLSLAQYAAYWRGHKPQHVRVYTNADIARLHGG